MSALPQRQPDSTAFVADPQSPKIDLESIDCLLCGGREFDTVIVAGDPLTKLGGNFRVVRCVDCGLNFTNPRPTPESIGIFYPSDYACWTPQKVDNSRRAQFEHRLQHAALRTFHGYPDQPVSLSDKLWGYLAAGWFRKSADRQNWIPWRAPGRMLDFGCGAGDFLVEMRSHGWQVTGMDMSRECANSVTDRTGIPVHVGTFPHADIVPESFDCVTMWNALEHVHEPRKTVAHAREALRPGGLLTIGVPNIGSWAFRKFMHEWYPLKVPRHLTHFTLDTLVETVRAEGFKPLSADHISRPGFLRKSARKATASKTGPRYLQWLRYKQLATPVASWMERTHQADFIRVIAEKQ